MQKLQDKISLIQSAATQEDAFLRFNELISGYGYNNNVYTFLTDHPSIGQEAYHGVAATYPPDWIDFYNANQYRRIDPVWGRLLTSPVPFFWTELLDRLRQDWRIPGERLKAALRVMDEAGDAGVADGIGISYVSPTGEMAAVGLSGEKAEKERSYEDLAWIFLMATFFHEKFLSFYDRPEVPRLTPREHDVLCRAAEGMSDFDISCILGVSASTVRFHWKNIFEKLGVSGRLRAVIKAMQLQIVSLHPVSSPFQN